MHVDLQNCYWFDALPTKPVARPVLQQDIHADVAIVGAGYTGLWTAYHLKRLDPALRIVILEAEHVGFGASGRNGGWLMGAIEGLDSYLAPFDPDTREIGHDVVHSIVSRAEEIIRAEEIDCDFAHGGAIYAAARYPEQLSMTRAYLEGLRKAGHGEQDYRWLSAAELQSQANVRGAQGAVYTPHVAAVQPAKLVLGLAVAVERLGVTIYENSRVTFAQAGELVTATGSVKAPVILSATEGYSADLMSMGRYILPFQSGMVATEPLPDTLWEEIGFQQRPVLADFSRLSTYMQRTADNRLVFGARGDYRFGGKPISSFSPGDPAFAARRELAIDFFPALREVNFTHAWGGTLGISRRFVPHVVFDVGSGLGTAGGYVGEGVGASFLFGQTLAELVTQKDTERTRLPWVFKAPLRGALSRWEPEPLRWLGFKLAWSIYGWEESAYSGGRAGRWQKKLLQQAANMVERLLS